MSGLGRWAESVFGHAVLGDERRTRRLVLMARRAASSPAGRITDVYRIAAERQAAYDFLEHDDVSVDGVGDAVYRATARASRGKATAYVVLDGSSLTLTDEQGAKGFGRIGSFASGARGLKVINALVLSPRGAPIGLSSQVWWMRHERVPERGYRRVDERESTRWHHAVDQTVRRFVDEASSTKLHFIGDREADAKRLLRKLVTEGHEFTIRSNATRKVSTPHGRRDLREMLRQTPVLRRMRVDVPATKQAAARIAWLDIRAAHLPVILRDHHINDACTTWMTVVWATERTTSPSKIEWVLFTNRAVKTARDAISAVQRYAWRWRIEDFHRTWKSGLCCVEQTQLRSTNAVIKWATILAAVASRAERLRHRARETPEAPATEELTSDEIDAVVYLKNEGRRTKLLSPDGLTIATATRWIADLGGYVGNRGSGPPGATTIARGLERVLFAAELMARLRADGRLR